MKELNPIIIDLEAAKSKKIEESFLATLGWGIRKVLGALLGGVSIPVELKGDPRDVQSFLGTLGAEKRYIEDFKQFGLDNPRTYKSKELLNTSVGKFERKTGIKWPFK